MELFNTPGRRRQSAFYQALTECTEGVQHGTERGIPEKMRRRHPRGRRLGHAPWPGTIRPSRNWAGT